MEAAHHWHYAPRIRAVRWPRGGPMIANRVGSFRGCHYCCCCCRRCYRCCCCSKCDGPFSDRTDAGCKSFDSLAALQVARQCCAFSARRPRMVGTGRRDGRAGRGAAEGGRLIAVWAHLLNPRPAPHAFENVTLELSAASAGSFAGRPPSATPNLQRAPCFGARRALIRALMIMRMMHRTPRP